MTDLLLELFSEEIPARMQAGASEAFGRALAEKLKEARLEFSAIVPFSTPRRIAFRVEGLPSVQPDISVEKKGPKTSAPQAAIDGFLKSSGLTLDQLEKRGEGKDETYFAMIHQKGQPTADALKPIIESIIVGYTWPKSMRWNNRDTVWVRPLHTILCIFDGTVVQVQFGHISAGNVTRGHRFLAPDGIKITDAQQYETLLEKAFVIASREKRREYIANNAAKVAGEQGLTVKADEGLLDEVTGLVECPVVLLGSIDAQFMDLPPEVLSTVMKQHQKYFTVLKKDGTIAPHFITVANMKADDGGKRIIAGNERVLRARLSDGRFFWDQDRKKTLDEWNRGLSDVVFHAKIGTVAQKVERITTLAVQLAEYVPGADKKLVARAAELCKADLVTGMVGEFAELQGLMGRYYAQGQKEDAAVADAIRDHYSPQGPNDSCPSAPVSICVALADKIDTLTSMFAIGEKPTGSKDPFALRRAALGIIRIILENGIRIPLNNLFQNHLSLVENDVMGTFSKWASDTTASDVLKNMAHTDVVIKLLLDFFSDRLKVSLKDKGVRHDLISAVFDGGNEDDLVRVVARVKALENFLATEDGSNLLAASKRANNIILSEAKKEKKDAGEYAGNVEKSKLTEQAEILLFERMEERKGPFGAALKNEEFEKAMGEIATLRQSVDSFFDKVIVNDKEAEIRLNRLRLLSTLNGELNRIANFSLIEG